MLGFHPTLLWVDLEMSGLDPINNRILEFACILSDKKVEKHEEGPHIIINCDEEHLQTMDEWNMSHHTASGLYKSCIESQITLKDAEDQIIDYLKSKGVMQGQLVIAGNSVHQDKLFLFHHMPRLNSFLHYRILDVSSMKIVVNAIHPHLFFKKKNSHRAVDDIYESMNELKFYIEHAFKP